MACASPSNICVTCEVFSAEQKPKLGILLCIGCQKYFCFQHMAQHRQFLTESLENGVVSERNLLQEKVSTYLEQQWSTNIQVQLETIDQWELRTTEDRGQASEAET